MRQRSVRAGRRPLGRVTVAACAVAALVAPAPMASAANVSMESTGLFVNRFEGSAYNLLILGQPSASGIGSWIVRAQGSSTLLGARAGCTGDFGQLLSAEVKCNRTSSGVKVVYSSGNDVLNVSGVLREAFSVEAGAGNDQILTASPAGISGSWTVNLGAGNDGYDGSEGTDAVQPGLGTNTVRTFQGADTISSSGGDDTIFPGADGDRVNPGDGAAFVREGPQAESTTRDNYSGGGGFDVIDYSLRTTPIFSSFAVSLGEGAAGENDSIVGFEMVRGGTAGDTVVGHSSVGNGGADTLDGGAGNDLIDGGLGADSIRGLGGNDTIDANDGLEDTRIECNSGSDDRVEIDRLDAVLTGLRSGSPSLVPSLDDCETIDRRDNEAERGTIIATSRARLDAGARAKIRLRCPRRGNNRHRRPKRCAGLLRLKLAENGATRPSAKRYRLRRGQSRQITVQLTSSEAGRVSRARRGLAAVVTSSERDRTGVELVVRKIRVKRR